MGGGQKSWASSIHTMKTMQANKSTDTLPERQLRSALFSRGLRFRKNAIIVTPQRKVCADVVFPRVKVVVFLDGCFWHGCPQHRSSPTVNADYWTAKLRRNKERDDQVNGALGGAGWLVVRVWEHEPVQEAAMRVAKIVSERVPRRACGCPSKSVARGKQVQGATPTPWSPDDMRLYLATNATDSKPHQ